MVAVGGLLARTELRKPDSELLTRAELRSQLGPSGPQSSGPQPVRAWGASMLGRLGDSCMMGVWEMAAGDCC